MIMDKSSTDAAMSDTIAAEMQSIVRAAANPWSPGDSVKAGILRASRRLGLSYRRTKTFWYGAPCAVLATEADRLRRAELTLLTQRRMSLENEIAAIAARLDDKETANDAANVPDNRTILSLASRRLDAPGKLVRRTRVTA